jgi:hypothetical protein
MAVETVLFQALEEAKSLKLPPGIASSGKKFEDFMFKQLYHAVRQHGAVDVYPPRYTLRQPSFSGVLHQFDIVVQGPEQIAVECKFRKRTGIDTLFAFLGKLIDYRQPPKGIFVTTAEKMNDGLFCYAIAHRISVVCPFLPPVEYMLQCVKSGTDLTHRLGCLAANLKDAQRPKHVLIQWKNEYRRFVSEGYHR